MSDQQCEHEGDIEKDSTLGYTKTELTEYIQRFEHIYETSSKNMAKAVSVGVVRETEEIAEWMRIFRERLGFGDGYSGEKEITQVSKRSPEKSHRPNAEQKRPVRKIPVRKVTSDQMRSEMSASVRKFEQRYEMSSADMLELLSNDLVRETGDILKWMFDYRVLQELEREETRTTGIPGTTS